MSEIATPGLSFVGELSAAVGPPVDVGTTPHGIRRIVPILAGEMTGPRLAGKVELGAIAGRKDRRFRRERALQFHQRVAHALDVKHHPLAHRERRGMVIQSQGIEHAALRPRL